MKFFYVSSPFWVSFSGLRGGRDVCGYDGDSPMGDDLDESVHFILEYREYIGFGSLETNPN